MNYRDFKNDPQLKFEEGDRVVILEDTDGDGKADSSKILQNSLMPDPRYLGLDQQDVADVTEYLLTLR